MSDIFNPTETATAEGNAPSPTVTHYQQVAGQVQAAITAALAQIAPLETSHPATRDFVRANAAVDRKFLGAVVAAIENNLELETPRLSAATARDMLQFVEAFEALATQLLIIAKNFAFTIALYKAKFVQEALHAYSNSKRYAKNPNSGLRPYVEVMRRELGRAKHAKKVAAPPDSGTEVQAE